MNFRDFYRDGVFSYSLEIFPPKDESGVAGLFEALRDLSAFKPSFISCTYGAMGSTRDITRDLVIRIKRELGLTAAFHFTCVGSGRAAIQSYVEGLKKEGIDLVVALRGDPPQGTERFVKPADGFAYANELVEFLRKINGFSIAVAGYPEGHIEAPDLETDLKNLKRKVNAGADIVITQLFFDNQHFFNFVERTRRIGIKVPVIPGIMPILNVKQIEKITRLCGATLPEALSRKLSQFQDDPQGLIELGIEHAVQQCRDLLKHGVPGIHFYILNKAFSVRRVLEQLQSSI